MKRSIRFRRRILPRLKPWSFVFTIDIDDVLSDLDPGLAAWRAQR